jgi:hypothetical protein
MALKNNLQNMRTYLAGAMDRVADGGAGWRNTITPMLEELKISVLNPCKKPVASSKESQESRMIIQHYKETGQFNKIREEFGHIRNADLRCVDVSDFLIAHIDIRIHACGAYEEITTANRQKKPVLIWCEQGKQMAPNWLFFMLPHEHIFGSMDQLIAYLYEISMLENTDDLKRWFFIRSYT